MNAIETLEYINFKYFRTIQEFKLSVIKLYEYIVSIAVSNIIICLIITNLLLTSTINTVSQLRVRRYLPLSSDRCTDCTINDKNVLKLILGRNKETSWQDQTI